MRRKFLLSVAIVACLGAAAVPMAASARTAKVSSVGSRLATLSGKVAGLSKVVGGLLADDRGLKTRVKAIEDLVPVVQTALTALADNTTGLRALNLARPKFAVVQFTYAGGNVAAGGKVDYKGTPGVAAYRVGNLCGNALAGTGTTTGCTDYLIDFGQDVSGRSPKTNEQLQVFDFNRTVNAAVDTLNCGAAAAFQAACDKAATGTGVKPNANYALVVFGYDDSFNPGGTATAGQISHVFNTTEIAP